jgi:hypothetical protein
LFGGGTLRAPAFSGDERGDCRDAFGVAVAALPEQIGDGIACVAGLEQTLDLEWRGAEMEQRLQLGNGNRSDAMRLELLQQLGFVGERRADQRTVLRVVRVAEL